MCVIEGIWLFRDILESVIYHSSPTPTACKNVNRGQFVWNLLQGKPQLFYIKWGINNEIETWPQHRSGFLFSSVSCSHLSRHVFPRPQAINNNKQEQQVVDVHQNDVSYDKSCVCTYVTPHPAVRVFSILTINLYLQYR